MICNSMRASARVGCRRALHFRLTPDQPLQAFLPPARLNRQELLHSAAARHGGAAFRDWGLGTRHRAGFSSSSHHSAHRASDKDSSAPSPPTALTWADKWKATRSKVSAEYLKRFLKKYGRVAVAFHLSVFFTTLGTCYSVVDYGGLDIPALVKDIPILANNLPPASAGNLAIAYGMTSAIGPPRAVLTVLVTPKIAKMLDGRESKRRDDRGTP